EYRDIARQEGNRWLLRNQTYYQALPNLKILRWDHWLKHAKYPEISSNLKTFFKKDFAYRDAFEFTIMEFLKRYMQRLTPEVLDQFNYARAYGLCSDYLLEECTAMCLWPELNCHVEVYPNKRNAAMRYTHEHFVLPEYPHLLHPVSIKFKQRKQLQPQ